MEAGVIFAAIAGLLAGAGGATWLIMNAPRLAGHLTLFATIAVFLFPILMSFSARDQLIESAIAGGIDELKTRAMISIFVLSTPLGALAISMFKDVGRRMRALVTTGLVGLPLYLMLTTSITAASVFAGVG